MEENNVIEDTEVYMLAQFIDVLENIENFNNINDVKKDIKERKKAYSEEIKNIISKNEIVDIVNINEKLSVKLDNYNRKYNNKEYEKIKEEIEKKKKHLVSKKDFIELEKLIYKRCNYDAKCTYKIGMLEGIKITLKNKI